MFASKSRRLIASAALLITAVSAGAAAAQHLLADISGTWIISAQSPNGASESNAVLKQEGTAVTGTIDVPDLGSAKITGTVKGDTVLLAFSLDVQGTAIPVQMSGMVSDKNNMAGTVILPQEMGNYPYTAKRKP